MKKLALLALLVLSCCSTVFAIGIDNRQAIVIWKDGSAQLGLAKFSADQINGHRVKIAHRAIKNGRGEIECPVYADCVIRGVDQDDTYVNKTIRLPMTRAPGGSFKATEFLSTGLLCEFDGTYLDYITEIRVTFVFHSGTVKEREFAFNIEDLSQVLYNGQASSSFAFLMASKTGLGENLAAELQDFFNMHLLAR